MQRLLTYKGSGDPRQNEVFKCMVHNMLDEHRFFPNYPDKELNTTGHLFGRVIALQLFMGADLAVALRHVADALSEPPDSKLFRFFGVGALQHFRGVFGGLPTRTGEATGLLRMAGPASTS